jgi:anthranilate phosphoribosyltransferase
MLNPYQAAHSFQGVHHKHVDDKHIGVAQLLGDKNTLCIRGEGGEPEVDPSKETYLRLCRGSSITAQHVTSQLSWEIKPKALNIASLNSVWKGALMHNYGESTVISTLASLLVLLNEQSLPEAFMEAKKRWESRNGKRFLGIALDDTVR